MLEWGGPLTQYDWCPYEGQWRLRLREDGVGCRNTAYTNQEEKGQQVITKAGRKHGIDSSSEPLESTDPSDLLILDFWPPRLWKNKFLQFKISQYFAVVALWN